MKAIFCSLLFIVISFQSQAGVYKCVIDGKTTYSGDPCSDSAEKIEVTIRKPKQRDIETVNNRNERISLILKASALKKKILKSEKNIVNLHESMDGEINRLKRKKLLARNNLAGATWKNSISSEIDTVIERQKIKINSEENKIKMYREQLARLEV